MAPPNLVTIPRAAKLTGVPERTIYNWVRIRRAQCWTVAEEIRLVDVDQLLALKRQRETGFVPRRQREPVNYRALQDAATEWDTVAAVQWCAGRDELGAAYAVCAFFAWLEVLGEQRAREHQAAQNMLTGDEQCARGADTTQDNGDAHGNDAEQEEAPAHRQGGAGA